MKLSEMSPVPGSVKENYRKGRGHASGNGKQAGRGHKGQNARNDHSHVYCTCIGARGYIYVVVGAEEYRIQEISHGRNRGIDTAAYYRRDRSLHMP